MKIFKYIIYGLALLPLFHYETLYIGPIKISHLWKGVVLVYLFFSIIITKQKAFIYKPFIWIAILQLVNIELLNNPFNALVNFGTILLLPVLGIYLLRLNYYQLRKALIFFASFFILSFIPYQFGILDSIREGYNLSTFGGTSGLIGPFQNPHGAAISLASALIVVLHYWFEGCFNKLYLTLLFILGFYFLLSTYVRTGLAMFVIGSIPTLMYFAKKQARTFFQLAVFAFFMSILASNWILSNEVLMNRITGQNKYRSEETFESMGSGRVGIYIASLEIFAEANIKEKAFGIGESEQMSRIHKITNMRIGSHNGFLDVLLQNGIIGLLFLFTFFFRFYKLKNLIDRSPEKALVKSMSLSFFVMTLVQGYDWITANLLFMLSISLIYQNTKQSFYEKKLIAN